MLTSPQTVTIDAVASELHKTSTDSTSSVYSKPDGSLTLKISHQKGKARTRRMVRLDQKLVVADVLTGLSNYQTVGAYFVIDEPNNAVADDVISKLVAGLQAWLSAANVSAILASRH